MRMSSAAVLLQALITFATEAAEHEEHVAHRRSTWRASR